MATAYKILGQANPTSGSASTEVALYTVASPKTGAVLSTISVCNTTSSAATYSIAIRQGGATLSTKQYFASGTTIPANTTTTYTVGLTLATNDVVGVYSSSTGLAFQAFGSELS
jgi:hypothetical protein